MFLLWSHNIFWKDYRNVKMPNCIILCHNEWMNICKTCTKCLSWFPHLKERVCKLLHCWKRHPSSVSAIGSRYTVTLSMTKWLLKLLNKWRGPSVMFNSRLFQYIKSLDMESSHRMLHSHIQIRDAALSCVTLQLRLLRKMFGSYKI